MFGLLIGVRVNNQNSAVQAVALVKFLTALLLSGFIYPISNIPFPLSLVSAIIPAPPVIILKLPAMLTCAVLVGLVFGSQSSC
jgi:ABC-2 type transport system permease protein